MKNLLLIAMLTLSVGCNGIRRLTGQDEHRETQLPAQRMIALVGTWNGYYKTDKIGPTGASIQFDRMAEGPATFTGQWNDGVRGGIDGTAFSNFTGTVNNSNNTFTLHIVSADPTCGGTFDIGGTLELNAPGSVSAINFTSIHGSNCLGAHTTIEGSF